MISGLREWAVSADLLDHGPLTQLEDATIAIDAEDYIDKILSSAPTREPLLPALGGIPFTIDKVLEERINVFHEHKIRPLFVFGGLVVEGQARRLQASLQHSKNVGEAWDLYNAHDPDGAVLEFGNSSTFDAGHIYRYVQSFFHSKNVDFIVAPGSATAQLATMEGTDFADAIAGTTELLMFEVERVIVDFDFSTKEFNWLTRRNCIEAVGLGSTGLFIDACLFAGSSFLPTLPHLANDALINPSTPRFKTAVDLLKRLGGTGNDICLQLSEEPTMRSSNYVDQYRKAVMSIKHHIHLTVDGKVELLRKDEMPNDVNLIVGPQLPEELYGYLSRAIIGPRTLSWRTSGEILESPPLDGGLSLTFQILVRDQLMAMHTTSLALLSYNLHRFYQHQDVQVRFWFTDQTKTISIQDATDPKTAIASWNIPMDVLSKRATALDCSASSLIFAVGSLRDTAYCKDSITPRPKDFKPMEDSDQICANTLARYLQLRGYVSSDHTYTPLGKSLDAAFKALPRNVPSETSEAVYLAIELLRLKLLNSDNMFPSPPYVGAPFRGSEADQRNTLLVSRVACLGSLGHKSIGYTGPLSRHLLAYHSVISAVRDCQRDLVEMCLGSLLFTGAVDRRLRLSKLQEAAFKLPFLRDVDCALGIAVKHYLDELSAQPDPASTKSRDEIKEKGRSQWFPHALDFSESLGHAFTLWDAVFAAVKVAPGDVVSSADKEEWAKVDAWLADRR